MDFRQVEAFHAVIQTRSMTLAAAQLHTSQPNISRLIARLQKETGLVLFKRVGLRLVPTPEAEALFREVQRSFVGLAELQRAASTIRELGTGGIRVGVSMGLSVGLLPQALQDFRRRRPDVSIKVHTSDSATVCKWVSAGFCDFGIAAFVPEMPELVVELLHRENGPCIVPSDHRLARKRRVHARDLDGEAFISLSASDPMRSMIDAAFSPDNRQLTLDTPYAITICKMVSLGLGVSVVSPMVWRSTQWPGAKAIPFVPSVEFRCYAVRAQHRVDPALATELLQSVRQVLAAGTR